MPTAFPRTHPRTEWSDNGQKLLSAVGEKCPNCGSKRYCQTVSTEDCPDCGLHCDYWGGGANDVYKNCLATRDTAEKDRLQLEQIRADDQL